MCQLPTTWVNTHAIENLTSLNSFFQIKTFLIPSPYPIYMSGFFYQQSFKALAHSTQVFQPYFLYLWWWVFQLPWPPSMANTIDLALVSTKRSRGNINFVEEKAPTYIFSPHWSCICCKMVFCLIFSFLSCILRPPGLFLGCFLLNFLPVCTFFCWCRFSSSIVSNSIRRHSHYNLSSLTK